MQDIIKTSLSRLAEVTIGGVVLFNTDWYNRTWDAYFIHTAEQNQRLGISVSSMWLAHFVRDYMTGVIKSTEHMSVGCGSGEPVSGMELVECVRAVRESLFEFYDQFIIIGTFPTDSNVLEPVIAVRTLPDTDKLAFLRSAGTALDLSFIHAAKKYGILVPEVQMHLASMFGDQPDLLHRFLSATGNEEQPEEEEGVDWIAKWFEPDE